MLLQALLKTGQFLIQITFRTCVFDFKTRFVGTLNFLRSRETHKRTLYKNNYLVIFYSVFEDYS